jgi:hypothetical protein
VPRLQLFQARLDHRDRPLVDVDDFGWDGDLDYTCRAGRKAGSKGR